MVAVLTMAGSMHVAGLRGWSGMAAQRRRRGHDHFSEVHRLSDASVWKSPRRPTA